MYLRSTVRWHTQGAVIIFFEELYESCLMLHIFVVNLEQVFDHWVYVM